MADFLEKARDALLVAALCTAAMAVLVTGIALALGTTGHDWYAAWKLTVIANMVQGADGKWRTMANERLYGSKMLIGALYRSELTREMKTLGYGIEKTHADGRFEIAGVSRKIIEAFSTRRAEIEAAMAGRGLGTPADNQRLAQRAALMTRAAKRDVDRTELREIWQRQAAELGFDAKQLDAVDTGKPFAQLQKAGMTTAVMDEILRQKDAGLKAAVRASLAGDIRKAFGKLGDRVAEVNPDNLAGAAAARWLKLSPRERENTGLMAPSHELRREINGHIREGRILGPALQTERLVSYGYTNAEKAVAANYAPGDVVAFRRDYRSLGLAKDDERRVASVDGAKGTVFLEEPEGKTVPWRPRWVGAGRGGVEVYKAEGIELRAGDRIRWTRNDAGLGLDRAHLPRPHRGQRDRGDGGEAGSGRAVARSGPRRRAGESTGTQATGIPSGTVTGEGYD